MRSFSNILASLLNDTAKVAAIYALTYIIVPNSFCFPSETPRVLVSTIWTSTVAKWFFLTWFLHLFFLCHACICLSYRCIRFNCFLRYFRGSIMPRVGAVVRTSLRAVSKRSSASSSWSAIRPVHSNSRSYACLILSGGGGPLGWRGRSRGRWYRFNGRPYALRDALESRSTTAPSAGLNSWHCSSVTATRLRLRKEKS